MELELVTVGTELLLGHTVDTNAAEIAEAVAAIGVRLARSTTVGDDGLRSRMPLLPRLVVPVRSSSPGDSVRPGTT
jgi:hypothetical protein